MPVYIEKRFNFLEWLRLTFYVDKWTKLHYVFLTITGIFMLKKIIK